MAHEIEITNGNAKMAYVGATPWHGLGKKLDVSPATVLEALVAADMANENVQLVQLHLADGTPVDCYATVRGRDGRVLGTGLSKDYDVKQAEEAFAFFDPFLASGLASIETVGTLREGARVWMLCKLNSPDAVIVPKADDRVSKYILLATGHDGHISHVIMLTLVRVVCQNTLSAAFGNNRGYIKIPHTRNAADTLRAVQDVVASANADCDKMSDFFRALARKRITAEKVRAYLEAVFPTPPKKEKAPAPAAVDGAALLGGLLARPVSPKDEIQYATDAAERIVARRGVKDRIVEILEAGGRGLDINGVKGTAWAAYNAVTEYLSHERGADADTRMNHLWLGGAASNLGTRALTAAKDVFLS